MIAFVFCLYGGMSIYVKYALKKIEDLKKYFENHRFIIIMDEQTAKEAYDYFIQDFIDIRIFKSYNNMSKSILLFRFLPIFEDFYSEYDIAILDVHDNTLDCITWIRKALTCFQKNPQKDVFFMYVRSPDDTCIYNASVHKSFHSHRDAGFSVWKKKGLDRTYLTKNRYFQTFLNDIQSTYYKYEYGADEVLFDVFLKNNINEKRQVLYRNKFISTACCGEGLDNCNKVIHSDMIEKEIHFTGKNSMYICARMDY